jgi:hypothetical protein
MHGNQDSTLCGGQKIAVFPRKNGSFYHIGSGRLSDAGLRPEWAQFFPGVADNPRVADKPFPEPTPETPCCS